MFPYDQENIVAIATPPGIGALAVVRLSGKDLKPLYKEFTHKQPKNRFALFTKLYHPKNNHILDEVVVTYFESPGSYTGEDIIEISCHGGTAVKNSVLQAAIDGGARLAHPGEFSYRSYLNGKMDLLQAEAVSAIISSKASRSAELSLYHLEGKVSNMLGEIKSKIIDVLSIIENELNFSEDEISLTSYSTIRSMLEDVQSQINQIVYSSVIGKKIFSGIRIIILGRPNTGKSSLFNAMLGHDRAITSPVAGTTRDTVESWFELEGVPVCLVDTAGVWESKRPLDNLGVEKTISELDRADLCLLVDDENPRALINTEFMKRLGKANLSARFSQAESLFAQAARKIQMPSSLTAYIKKAEIDYGYTRKGTPPWPSGWHAGGRPLCIESGHFQPCHCQHTNGDLPLHRPC